MSRQNLGRSRSSGRKAGIWCPKARCLFPMPTQFVLTRKATWSISHWRISTDGHCSGSWSRVQLVEVFLSNTVTPAILDLSLLNKQRHRTARKARPDLPRRNDPQRQEGVYKGREII